MPAYLIGQFNVLFIWSNLFFFNLTIIFESAILFLPLPIRDMHLAYSLTLLDCSLSLSSLNAVTTTHNSFMVSSFVRFSILICLCSFAAYHDTAMVICALDLSIFFFLNEFIPLSLVQSHTICCLSFSSSILFYFFFLLMLIMIVLSEGPMDIPPSKRFLSDGKSGATWE